MTYVQPMWGVPVKTADSGGLTNVPSTAEMTGKASLTPTAGTESPGFSAESPALRVVAPPPESFDHHSHMPLLCHRCMCRMAFSRSGYARLMASCAGGLDVICIRERKISELQFR